MRDVYVFPYPGSQKWGWRFETGVTQKLCKDKEEALYLARQKAKLYQSDLYIQEKNDKFIKEKL
jgi:hypothetical protein